MALPKNITNNKYGRLTAIKFVEKRGQYHFWLFKCDCGKEKIISKNCVMVGGAKSCGCLRDEKISILNKTHGLSHSRINNVWLGMKGRCNDKNNSWYGARNIKCEWKSFEEFYQDMFLSYKEGLTIERIDNNGNYSKQNCRWATPTEQANNRRSNHYLSFNGKNQSIANWARELGINYNTIKTKISRHYPIEKILI